MRVLSSIVFMMGAIATALALKEPPTDLQVGTVHHIIPFLSIETNTLYRYQEAYPS
jgi:hypothetical protein